MSVAVSQTQDAGANLVQCPQIRVPVCVPSQKAFQRLTSTFIPSFAKFMSGKGRHDYFLVLNCEGYTDQEIKLIQCQCDSTLQNDFVLIKKDYPKPASMTQIRHDTSLAASALDIHLFCDDDFEFRPGSVQKYNDAVDYMVSHPQCGMVQCKSFLGGAKWGNDIKPAFGGMYFTAQGLMLRMIRDEDSPLMIPDSVRGIPGGYEDPFVGYHYWTRGFYVAKQMNNPTLHRHAPWGSERIHECKEGGQAVPVELNGKNPSIVASSMGAQINRLVGAGYYVDGSKANMEKMLGFRPSIDFWKSYIRAAIGRFGYWALEGMNPKNVQRGYSTNLGELGL